MTLLKVNNRGAAELKAERERDKIQAMRDYEAETLARQANMIRLRALRLAKESADAQATTARRPAKKKAANRNNPDPRPYPGRGRKRTSS
jgi:hypothetical protein